MKALKKFIRISASLLIFFIAILIYGFIDLLENVFNIELIGEYENDNQS